MVAVGTIIADHPRRLIGSWLLLRWQALTLGMEELVRLVPICGVDGINLPLSRFIASC
jgi:hypothetical protein